MDDIKANIKKIKSFRIKKLEFVISSRKNRNWIFVTFISMISMNKKDEN